MMIRPMRGQISCQGAQGFCLSMGSGIKLTREELTLTQILNMNSAANLYNSLILSSGTKFVENGVLYSTIGYYFSV